MITCSMPAATASSTAYWITGLSTSGSISFGCALVAGRNRVPQPAAGKTALRTRIEPHGKVGPGCGRDAAGSLAGPRVPPGTSQTRCGSGRERGDELLDEGREGLGLVDVGQVAGPRDHPVRDAENTGEEPPGADSEDQVHRAVDDEDLATVGEQLVAEPSSDEALHGRGSAPGEVPACGDRRGHGGAVAASEPGQRHRANSRLGGKTQA